VADTYPLLAVRGIDQTSSRFREQLVAGALAHGLNPSYVAAVIAFESGFNPKAVNYDRDKDGNIIGPGALGLIQWRKTIFPATARKAGMSVAWEDLPKLTAEQQLPLVFAYYADKPIGDASSPSDYYLTVFLPIGVNKPQDFLLGQKDSTAKHPGGLSLGVVYEKNKGLDRNPTDGTITVRKAAAPVLDLLAAARGRAPLLVPLDPGLPTALHSTWPSPGGVYSSPLPRPAPLPSTSGPGVRGSGSGSESDGDFDMPDEDSADLGRALLSGAKSREPRADSSDLPTVRKGDHGAAVCLLQRLLEVTSPSESEEPIVSVDGEFGYETEAALRLHQREIRDKLGLAESDFPDDGVCGPRTWASFWQPWAWSLDRLGKEVTR
jgi:peptidoglycan hydrolase-like protein with peptidoglycan-binding domain